MQASNPYHAPDYVDLTPGRTPNYLKLRAAPVCFGAGIGFLIVGAIPFLSMWARLGFTTLPAIPPSANKVCLLFGLTALGGMCLLGASFAIWLKKSRLSKFCLFGVGIVFGMAVICAL